MKPASSSKVRDLSSLVLRVSSQSRMKKMLRLTRHFPNSKRNSNKSRFMMPSQHPGRRVSKCLRTGKRSKSQPSLMRGARAENVNANLGHLKHLRKPKKTVTMALSKLTAKRDAVAKAEEVAAVADLTVAASIREKEKSTTITKVALAPTRTMRRRPPHLSNRLNQLPSLKRKYQSRWLFMGRSLTDGTLSSSENHSTNLHDQALVL